MSIEHDAFRQHVASPISPHGNRARSITRLIESCGDKPQTEMHAGAGSWTNSRGCKLFRPIARCLLLDAIVALRSEALHVAAGPGLSVTASSARRLVDHAMTMVQRIKEIASSLGVPIAGDPCARPDESTDNLVDESVEAQGRAVAGMMRIGSAVAGMSEPGSRRRPDRAAGDRAACCRAPVPGRVRAGATSRSRPPATSCLDAPCPRSTPLPLPEKLALPSV